MVDIGCDVTMDALNRFFNSPLVFNDSHDIYARLSAGEPIADVLVDVAAIFYGAKSTRLKAVQRVVQNWPDLHLEFVRNMVMLALAKIDSDDRLQITWKGDADNPE